MSYAPNTWTDVLGSAYRDADALGKFLGEELPQDVAKQFPLLVPRRLADKIKRQGAKGVLARQFLPSIEELLSTGLVDPIGDQAFAKTKQLVHRYDDRALVLPTTKCPVNCRYCFRKNELNEDTPFAQDRDATLNYLKAHPEIEEVVMTGGDPLILSDEKLDAWLEALAQIPTVQWVRFHSRVPVMLPERLNAGLWRVLDKHSTRFKKFLMVVHSNHTDEWDLETRETVQNFQHPRMEWLAQTVLLKGINDSASTLADLFRQFVDDGIRPYYLHHPDQVRGGMHFWLDLPAGRKLYGELRSLLPGWAIPQYVIDVPGGHGKVPAFNPEGHNFSGQLLDRFGRPFSMNFPDSTP